MTPLCCPTSQGASPREAMDNSNALLDMTVYGRQETWEDSPTGWPQQWKGKQHFRTDGRPTAQWSRLKAGYSDDGFPRTFISYACRTKRGCRSCAGRVHDPLSPQGTTSEDTGTQIPDEVVRVLPPASESGLCASIKRIGRLKAECASYCGSTPNSFPSARHCSCSRWMVCAVLSGVPPPSVASPSASKRSRISGPLR
jgi:hypothetical protein